MTITQIRKRHLWELFATFIAAILIAGLINLIIDPYGTFRLVEIKGLNRIKPNPDHDIEIIKAQAMRRASPDALILGNSRTEVGLDPSHPVWQEAGYSSVYNASIRGSSMSTAWHMLERATHRHSPKFVLLGVEFFDFLIAPNKPIIPIKGTNKTWFDDARWMMRATLTMQALLDSATTFRRQFQSNPEQLTDYGQTPLRNYLDMARTEGYWTLFNQRALENAKNLSRKPSNLFLQGTRSSPDFDNLRQIVRWTVQNNAELRLVIYPYHAQLLVMIDEFGLWPLFDDWKRQILHIVEEEAAQADARGRISLIDFSGFSSYAQEPIPAKRDKTSTTHWYWEAGHFKTELGDIMLTRIFSTHPPHNSTAFGVDLNSRNLEQHIHHLRAAKDEYRAGHVDIAAEVRGIVAKAKAANAGLTSHP